LLQDTSQTKPRFSNSIHNSSNIIKFANNKIQHFCQSKPSKMPIPNDNPSPTNPIQIKPKRMLKRTQTRFQNNPSKKKFQNFPQCPFGQSRTQGFHNSKINSKDPFKNIKQPKKSKQFGIPIRYYLQKSQRKSNTKDPFGSQRKSKKINEIKGKRRETLPKQGRKSCLQGHRR
jgi:hypothetical protein